MSIHSHVILVFVVFPFLLRILFIHSFVAGRPQCVNVIDVLFSFCLKKSKKNNFDCAH